MTRISQKVRDHVGEDNIIDGQLPAYAWPGGYPLFYLAADEYGHTVVLCPEHANAEADYDDDEIVAADVNWEDTELSCEHGHKIESAYGEDE